MNHISIYFKTLKRSPPCAGYTAGKGRRVTARRGAVNQQTRLVASADNS